MLDEKIKDVKSKLCREYEDKILKLKRHHEFEIKHLQSQLDEKHSELREIIEVVSDNSKSF